MTNVESGGSRAAISTTDDGACDLVGMLAACAGPVQTANIARLDSAVGWLKEVKQAKDAVLFHQGSGRHEDARSARFARGTAISVGLLGTSVRLPSPQLSWKSFGCFALFSL